MHHHVGCYSKELGHIGTGPTLPSHEQLCLWSSLHVNKCIRLNIHVHFIAHSTCTTYITLKAGAKVINSNNACLWRRVWQRSLSLSHHGTLATLPSLFSDIPLIFPVSLICHWTVNLHIYMYLGKDPVNYTPSLPQLMLLAKTDVSWWTMRSPTGLTGLVPLNYINIDMTTTTASTTTASRSTAASTTTTASTTTSTTTASRSTAIASGSTAASTSTVGVASSQGNPRPHPQNGGEGEVHVHYMYVCKTSHCVTLYCLTHLKWTSHFWSGQPALKLHTPTTDLHWCVYTMYMYMHVQCAYRGQSLVS